MDVYDALADPTRRRIVDLLAGGRRSAGALAGEFAISRPGVSRHLRVLREAGVVERRREGQRQVYSLAPRAFDEVAEWIGSHTDFWESRLDALAARASELDREE